VEYDPTGSIIVNGVDVNNPDKQTLENTKNSPIDLENWILKQQTIELKNINLSFLDSKNNLPKIQLFNVAASLNKLKHENHVFNLDIGKSKSDANKILSLFLSWKGGKVSQFQQWKEANLKVTSYNNNDTLANTMQKYIPNIAIIDKFNADTAIDAKLSNGKLQYFYANFDIKNLHYMFKNKSNFINFPQLGGSIDIKLHENNQYSILAKNLNLSTPYGYLFNNKNVTGNYVVGKNGQISIKDTDIQSFNNLISLLPKFNNFSLNGTLNIIKLSWIGKITRPSDFNIILNFKNFEIISKESNIPSFNNINGEININKESGAANFDLINSTLKYPKVFLIPYIFKKMHTNIRWQFHQDKSFDVFLDKTNIQTQDFNATLHGKYTYVPDTNGFLNLSAHLDKILISKVGDYLPKVIGVSVHKWLNNALIGGHAANGVLTLKGWIANFPFSDGNGMFYIDADVQNGKLRYVNDWPTLDNINGKFKIRNQKIIITTNDAYVNSNKITNAIVTIPNMIDPYRVYLTADGNAQGSTSNFLNYLANTPINHLIGNIPEKVSATGNGNVAIHLVIPFNNPKTSQVKGSYTFINNSLLFKLPIPQLDAVNGDLFFSEKGFSIDKISTTVLNNLAQINASDKNKQIIFNVLFPNLNSQDILNYYLPFFTPIFSGKTTANLSFDITSNGLNQLNVGSNLIGVKINAPYPLHKDESESKKLTLQLIPNNSDKFTKININYDNFLHALLNLQEHGKLAHANIIVGANNQQNLFTPNSPKILIDLNSDKLSGNEWLGTIVSLLENNKNNKSLVLESKASGQPQIKPHNESNGDIFPIEILSNVEQFSVYKTNYYHLDSDILVLKDKTIFNFNNTFTNGFGTYTNQNKDLNIVLNEFNAQTTVNEAKEKIAKHHNFPSYSSTDSDFTNLNSLAAINTNLGPHFNESNY
ncbi:MAG: DUF3971 domain-containing protein, partial [Burkholderiales bacterium]|nr:DUF3971 domain-containing protein [Burkholderiales bacterium]